MNPRCLLTTVAATAALTIGGLVAPSASAAPASPASPTSGTRGLQPATGTFEVVPDFSTFQATSTRSGDRCVLRVEADLVFAGTLAGTASGLTRARVDAPCSEVTTTPPGTYADTFRFTGDFDGTVADRPATARVAYGGLTRAGGDVSALLVLRGGARVIAAVDAQAGVGGSYRGVVWPR